jgi:hypothetical protein
MIDQETTRINTHYDTIGKNLLIALDPQKKADLEQQRKGELAAMQQHFSDFQDELLTPQTPQKPQKKMNARAKAPANPY